uniref:uncharacterized protein LOC122582421 n=1 Tax=Erigeron canadensis TaxID=72917 RepID=UPI001CB8A97B|nr:uncharacterized protein LOC122582421 [Erigeron canadensis]
MRIMKSDELKEAMKESPKRYTNPFLSDEENEKVNFWNDQELEHSHIKDGLINNCEGDKFRNSLAPCNVPSEFCVKETELYTDKNVMECELPELLVCYKEGVFHVKDICMDEGIPDGESVMFDENNNEILKHERLIFSPTEDYYMESKLCSGTNGKIDRDLPIVEPTYDCMNFEGIQDKLIEKNSDVFSETKIDADLTVPLPVSDQRNMITDTDIQNEDLQNSIPDKDYEDSDLIAAGRINDCGNAKNISTDMDFQNHNLNLIPVKDYEDAAAKECGISEEVSDSVVPNELKNMSKDDSDNEDGTSTCAPEKLNFSPESDAPPKAAESHGPDVKSSGDLLDNASTEQVVSNSVYLQQERPLPSLKSLLEAIRQQSRQSPTEEICKSTNISNDITMDDGNKCLDLIDGKPELSSSFHKVENLECVNGHSRESDGAPKLHDLDSDNAALVNLVHHGQGESSFSVAGPVSGLITYSGPIAHSGNISHRSDSSTTSTRSFAFPILPNEWNSSPVRMAKADRRRLRKSRGWRHGLLCCRF